MSENIPLTLPRLERQRGIYIPNISDYKLFPVTLEGTQEIKYSEIKKNDLLVVTMLNYHECKKDYFIGVVTFVDKNTFILYNKSDNVKRDFNIFDIQNYRYYKYRKHNGSNE